MRFVGLLVVSIAVLLFVLPYIASATCGNAYTYYRTLAKGGEVTDVIYINDTYGVNLGDGVQYIVCDNSTTEFCYDDSATYACYSGATKVATKTIEGNESDYGNLDDDLIGYWDLSEETSPATDNSLQNNSMVWQNNPTSTMGQVGKGIDFQAGDNDYLANSGDEAIYDSLSGFTITAWVEPDTTDSESIVTKHSGASNGIQLLRNVATANKLYYYVAKAGGGNVQFEGVTSVPIDTWSHIAFFMNTTDICGMINGKIDKCSACAGCTSEDSTETLKIGGDNGYFDGKMDEVMFWNRSLSEEEIEHIYNNTKPDDYVILGAETVIGNLVITSPENRTYNTMNVSFDWYNLTDYNAAKYSLDSAANITLDGNTTLVFTSSGSHNVTLWINSTTGTWYDETEYFTIELNTTINITSPNNGTYQSPPSVDITFDFDSALSCDTSCYSVNGGNNVSTGCSNTTIGISSFSGLTEIVIFVNNTEGYSNSDTLWLDVRNAINNCSAAGATESVKFYFYNEEDFSAMNGSAEYAITDIDSGFVYNLSVVNTTNFSICVFDPPRTVDMTMLYDSSGYDTRTYYFYQAPLTSTLQSINLLNIPSANSEKVEVNVRDANDQDVEGAYVNIQRYYVDENKYRTVTIGKTSSEGTFLLYVYPDDVFYKFIISEAGITKNTEGPMLMIDTADDPETLVLYTTADETEFFEIRENVGVNCYVNYTTNYTICTMNDATALISSAGLTVTHMELGGPETVCSSSGSGSAITLSCFLGGDANGTYNYRLIVETSQGNTFTLATGTAYFAESSVYEDFGLFPMFILLFAVVSIGVFMPVAAVILAVLGIAVGAALGIMEVSGGAIVSLAAVAVIIMIKGMKK